MHTLCPKKVFSEPQYRKQKWAFSSWKKDKEVDSPPASATWQQFQRRGSEPGRTGENRGNNKAVVQHAHPSLPGTSPPTALPLPYLPNPALFFPPFHVALESEKVLNRTVSLSLLWHSYSQGLVTSPTPDSGTQLIYTCVIFYSAILSNSEWTEFRYQYICIVLCNFYSPSEYEKQIMVHFLERDISKIQWKTARHKWYMEKGTEFWEGCLHR